MGCNTNNIEIGQDVILSPHTHGLKSSTEGTIIDVERIEGNKVRVVVVEFEDETLDLTEEESEMLKEMVAEIEKILNHTITEIVQSSFFNL